MKAIIKTHEGPGGFIWTDWPEPELKASHAIVEIERAGICSTDVAIYDSSYRGRQPVRIPSMVGHEAAGRISAVGSEVDGVAVGDRVSLQVIWGDPHARESLLGYENLDPDWRHIGASPIGGAFADRISIPADRVVRIPDRVHLDDAALLEPLAVATHAVELVSVGAGETVAIIGPGQFGLLMCQIAKANGAANVVVVGLVGIDDARLKVASKTGADVVIRHSETETTSGEILEATAGGADVVLDCGGTAESTFLALEAAAAGGRVGMFGFTQEARVEPLRQIIRKGLSVHGVSAAQRRHYGLALRLIETETVVPSAIVSHRLPLDRAVEGIELVQSRAASKVLLLP
jgi:threonine dehydrogenase-like Zn-dependent dehydrogenase